MRDSLPHYLHVKTSPAGNGGVDKYMARVRRSREEPHCSVMLRCNVRAGSKRGMKAGSREAGACTLLVLTQAVRRSVKSRENESRGGEKEP